MISKLIALHNVNGVRITCLTYLMKCLSESSSLQIVESYQCIRMAKCKFSSYMFMRRNIIFYDIVKLLNFLIEQGAHKSWKVQNSWILKRELNLSFFCICHSSIEIVFPWTRRKELKIWKLWTSWGFDKMILMKVALNINVNAPKMENIATFLVNVDKYLLRNLFVRVILGWDMNV